jgi:hypothetical protein
MKQKLVFIFLLLCLLANNLPPILSKTKVNASAAPGDSQVFNAAAMIRLQCVAVNELIKDTIPLFPQFSNRQSGNNARNSNKDLINNNCKQQILPKIEKYSNTAIYTTYVQIVSSMINVTNRGAPFGPDLFIFLFLLVYLIILSRSNLPVGLFVPNRYAL